MITRKFKDKKISQLGFGAMRLPLNSNDQADIDMKTTEEIIMKAYEQGVNYYDSAYVYHNGKSEEALGKVLNENKIRDNVNIATKLPTFVVDDSFDPYKLLDEQLARLGTDRIDFYLIHSIGKDKWTKLKEHNIIKFMDDVRKTDKIGAIGFSFHDNLEAYTSIIDEYDWDFNQIQLNFMDTEYQAGINGLEYAASKGISTVIMEPLKGGQLLMIQDPYVDELKKKYQLEDIPTAEICLNFIFDRPEILTVLSGMNAMQHVIENTHAASTMQPNSQPQNQKDFLKELRTYIETKNIIACTGCSYCTEDCPQDIPIPKLFEMYNNSVMFDSKEQNQDFHRRFNSNMNECIECAQCEGVCPQHLQIIKLLKNTLSYLDS